MLDDELLHVPPKRVAGQDAEIAADIGDDGTDRATADFGGDLICGGQACETRIGRRGERPGSGWPGLGLAARSPWSCVQQGGAPGHPVLEGLRAMQAAGDTRKDQRDVGGAEARSGEDGIGGDALADRRDEFLAVVDQLADEGEQVAGAAGLGVGLVGWW